MPRAPGNSSDFGTPSAASQTIVSAQRARGVYGYGNVERHEGGDVTGQLEQGVEMLPLGASDLGYALITAAQR